MRRATLALLVLGLAVATTAHASNPVRISQVYGGGGTYYKCDYVELFNNSNAPVAIGGWSIQYGSATGSSFGSATYNLAKIPSGATIPACGYYLISGYCSTASGTDLPVTPDLVPSSGWIFNFASTAGKVALFSDQVTGRSCAAAQAAAVDLVGYGSANCFETAPAATLDNSSVLVRAAAGAVDTDDNSTDFSKVAEPWPMHNSASAENPQCQSSAPPDTPTLVGPLDGAIDVARPVTLTVAVSDPDADSLTVQFYGRPMLPPPGPEFCLILLPDTQYYTAWDFWLYLFAAQTQWIVSERASRNIAAVAHLGDITDGNTTAEYMRADGVMQTLENPATTGLADGIPYVMNIGNHDGSSGFNEYFGVSRFSGRSYYGGHCDSTTNDNSYILFSAAGRDFILVSLANGPLSTVLTWAHGVIASYPSRLAIVVSHAMLSTGLQASWTGPGSAIYEALKDLPNLILMACGHIPGEGRRTDVYQGRPVTTMLSDYQMRDNGGDGWLRVLEFAPTYNTVRVRTYSPSLYQWEADADSSSQFTLNNVPLGGTSLQDFALLGTVAGVPSGSNAIFQWGSLDPERQHEWYVTISDRQSGRTGPVWRFTTAAAPTGVEGPAYGGLALAPPAPNPARGVVRFSFDLPRAMRVRLEVLDVQGRVVAALAEGDFRPGRHECTWDASAHGARAGAGLYFVSLGTPRGRLVRRVALLR
jgi:hypothetical protein